MVDFSGWHMPLHYGSQLEEHKLVRERAGLFDVSHMGVVDIVGDQALPYLQYLLANNAGRLSAGRALYTLMLNSEGGVVDDLLVYRRGDLEFRLIINCANRQSDVEWMHSCSSGYDVQIQLREELGILALQGPDAEAVLMRAMPGLGEAPAQLKKFRFFEQGDLMVARTGYTGEDGFEIVLPVAQSVSLWDELVRAGAGPAGLGARDTLRLEAGLSLYGHEMDSQTSPLESGLEWTIAWQPEEREFVGRSALQQKKDGGVECKLVGLELLDKGVLRQGQAVVSEDRVVGEITSGSFSPVLGKSIALARVPVSVSGEVLVEMRNKRLRAAVTQPPFVRNGKVNTRD